MPLKSADLLNFLSGDAARIETALESTPQWQSWMRTEMAILLGEASFNAACSVPYPAPYPWYLSVLAEDRNNQRYAIEICAESLPVTPALFNKIDRLQWYAVDNLVSKWAVGIAYSTLAKEEFRNAARNTPPPICQITERNNLCFLVWNTTAVSGPTTS